MHIKDNDVKEELNKYLSDLIFRDYKGPDSFKIDSVQHTKEGLNIFVKPNGLDKYLKIVIGLIVVDADSTI